MKHLKVSSRKGAKSFRRVEKLSSAIHLHGNLNKYHLSTASPGTSPGATNKGLSERLISGPFQEAKKKETKQWENSGKLLLQQS
ncbi:hypothetical protein TNCV_1966671 [Trichonephila clavipes]|nr:hypothetical protein TNCV_1966671 [Trichonephila clavipes]